MNGRFRTILIILILVFLALNVLAWLPLIPFQEPDRLATGAFAADQVEFQRHLELGYAAEQQQLYAQAQEEYQQAALAVDQEIARVGRENYERLAALQQDPRFVLYSQLQWLKSPLLWAAFLLALLLIVIQFRPLPVAYRVGAFSDLTKDQVGKPIQALVARGLAQAQEAYKQAQDEINLDLKSLSVALSPEQSDPFSNLLAVLGNLQLGAVPITVEKLQNLLEKWRIRNLHLLGGHFYQLGDLYYLDVEIKRGDRVVESWCLPASSGEKANVVVQEFCADLTYRFLFYMLHEKGEFRSWRALKSWTEGLQAYQRPGILPEDLDAVVQTLPAVENVEPGNRKLAFLVGLLNSRLERYAQAQEAFKIVLNGSDLDDDLSLAAVCRLGETFYLGFESGSFRQATAQFEQIRHKLEGKKLNKRQEKILAMALCGLAKIWAHQLYRQDLAKEHTARQLGLIESTCKDALTLSGEFLYTQGAAHTALGIAYQNFGRPEDALREFSAAVEARRDYPGALIYKAEILIQMIFSKPPS